MDLRQKAKDFRNGLSVIFGKPEPGEGDRKLAKMAILAEGQIAVYGKHAVQIQIAKSIESDLKRAAKKGKESVDRLVETALGTPEYVRMLHKVGLDEPYVRVMAMEALKNAKK